MKKQKGIKMAFISTMNSLNQISSLGDIQYCLAPYAIKYGSYFDYFKNIKSYTILDDTIAEDGGSTSHEDLVWTAVGLKVDEIIVPDVIGNYEKTRKSRIKFLDEYYNTLSEHNIKIQSVIQGETLYEYIMCLQEVEEDSRIDVIGIPFRMNYSDFKGMTDESSRMYNRVMFINNSGFIKPIHLLGNNLPIELVLLNDHPSVRSCDSKLMARYGLSRRIFNLDDLTKPSKKLLIEDKMDSKQIKIAVENINKLNNELGDFRIKTIKTLNKKW